MPKKYTKSFLNDVRARMKAWKEEKKKTKREFKKVLEALEEKRDEIIEEVEDIALHMTSQSSAHNGNTKYLVCDNCYEIAEEFQFGGHPHEIDGGFECKYDSNLGYGIRFEDSEEDLPYESSEEDLSSKSSDSV